MGMVVLRNEGSDTRVRDFRVEVDGSNNKPPGRLVQHKGNSRYCCAVIEDSISKAGISKAVSLVWLTNMLANEIVG